MNLKKYWEILSYLRSVIRDTEWEGKVYTVGGCLRDAMMDHDIHDVDLAVELPDGGVQFPIWLHKQGLTYGEPILYRRFSSSRLRLRAFPEEEIEVVQTRKEQYTDANSRNPEVCFGSLQDDCERRDLTINSLYQNVSTGEVLDLTGRAKDDIKNHCIQTPMAPDDTYSDDPIRILRTLRFAVRYGWDIPDHIMQSMKDNAGRMKIVRRPRIRTEFEKIMESNDPVKLLRLMKELGVIFKVMPELCHLYRVKDHSMRKELGPNAPLPTLWDMTMKKLGEAGNTLEQRFAALFSQFHRLRIPYSITVRQNGKNKKVSGVLGRNDIVNIALKRLMFDRDFIRRVKILLPPVVGDPEEAEEWKVKEKRERKERREKRGRRGVNNGSKEEEEKVKKRKKRRRRRKRNGSKRDSGPIA